MRITSTSHHQIHKPTCICVHPSSPPPITTGEGTFILKRANFRNLGFLTHLLSPSRRPLLLIFSTFPSLIVLTNKHMSSILKRKTCLDPTLAPPQLLSFLSFEVTLLKKLKFFYLLIYFSIHSNLSPVFIMPASVFAKAAEVLVPRSGAHIAVFTSRGSL